MTELVELLDDLRAESAELDRLVADLPAEQWAWLTPAAGWTIAHQIAHLAWSDRQAIRAATDPDGFIAELTAAFAAGELATLVDRGAEAGLAPPDELLDRWRAGRAELAEALVAVPAGSRLPWYGTTMSPLSSATGRLMETWAHGGDVADALGVVRAPTDRLRHIVYLGYRTRDHAFASHGRPVPEQPVYLELQGPDGSTWAYGPPDAADRITGPAVDFCLLVTQRRHRADLDLDAQGPVADGWLDVAQAFAGPPGPGRAPRTEPAGTDR